MKRLFLLAMTVLLLQGCAPAAFVAGTATGGALVYDKRSFKTMAQDQETTYQINVKLFNDKALSSDAHIHVATYNHTVLAVGQAPTPALRAHAIALIKTVPNIQRVYNQIELGGPTSTSVRSNDTWITTKVRAELTKVGGLKSAEFKVVTENSVVYLMGITTHQLGDASVNAARQVTGVEKVVKLFKYR